MKYSHQPHTRGGRTKPTHTRAKVAQATEEERLESMVRRLRQMQTEGYGAETIARQEEFIRQAGGAR